MHISVQMAIHIVIGFCHAHLCTNDYFIPNFFQCVSVKRIYFHVSLIFARINRLGREPWCVYFQW